MGRNVLPRLQMQGRRTQVDRRTRNVPGQAQAVEGAPVVVHSGQSLHVANGGRMVQKLEVLGGSQLGVSTVGRLPHLRIKGVVVGWMRVVQALSDGSGEQSAVVQPAAQVGRSRIRMEDVTQAANARRRRGTVALRDHVGQTQKRTIPLRLGCVAKRLVQRVVQPIREFPGPVHNSTDTRLHNKDGAVVLRFMSGVPKTLPKGPNVMIKGE